MNDKPAWLKDLRAQKMTIKVKFGREAEPYGDPSEPDPIEFRIVLKERFCNNYPDEGLLCHTDSAWERLKTWGLFDLPHQDQMVFVVAFDSITKSRRDGREIVARDLREIRIGPSGRGSD
jgi:hypothetical protein